MVSFGVLWSPPEKTAGPPAVLCCPPLTQEGRWEWWMGHLLGMGTEGPLRGGDLVGDRRKNHFFPPIMKSRTSHPLSQKSQILPPFPPWGKGMRSEDEGDA